MPKGARIALAVEAASGSAFVAARTARSPTTRRRAAVTQAQFDRAELILAIRNARAAGLSDLADRYQRVLDVETKRLNQSTAFSDLFRQAHQYGEHIAQKAHHADPSLPPAVLGNIAVNAANLYGNDTLHCDLHLAPQRSPSHEQEP
jgi:hypothetical protein